MSRDIENLTEMYLLDAKRILRYLQGTKEFGLIYKKGGKSDLIGLTNSDYVWDQDDRKSTLGYVFILGSGAISCTTPDLTFTNTYYVLVKDKYVLVTVTYVLGIF